MKKIIFLLSMLIAVVLSLSIISYAAEVEILPPEETTSVEETVTEEETTAPEEGTTVPEEETTVPEEETTVPEEETTAPEEETTAPEEESTEEQDDREKVSRFFGDVNGDGKITASDARSILRYSVALETMGAIDILFADANEDGLIRASDARIAIRTSVGLEDLLSGEFRINSAIEAACAEKGKTVAERADGRIAEYIINEAGHKLDDMASCKGEGVCKVCKETVKCKIEHDFVRLLPCDDFVKCSVCGEKKAAAPSHKYKNGKCTYCGYFDGAAAYKFMYDYVHKNGVYEAPDFCVNEDTDEMILGLYYDTELEMLYLGSNFYLIDENGNTVAAYNVYLDFSENLEKYSAIAIIYYGAEKPITATYEVDAASLNMKAPGAVTEVKFDGPAEAKAGVALDCEAIVIEMLIWFDDFAARKDFGFSSLDMGFVKL